MGNGGHLVHYCLEILLFEFILSHIINKPDIPAFQTISVNWHGKWNIVYRNQTKVHFPSVQEVLFIVHVKTHHYAKLCMSLILKTQFYSVLSMA